MEECHIYKESGDSSRALKLLEPTELDVMSLRSHTALFVGPHSQGRLKDAFQQPHHKQQFVEKLLLATQLLIDSQQQHGSVINERFKIMLKLCDTGHAASIHYQYAHYLDGLKSPDLTTHDVILTCYSKAILNESLCHKALPRLLTLWLSSSTLTPDQILSRAASGGDSKETSERTARQLRIARNLVNISEDTPAAVWFSCTPQLVSRLGHNNPDTQRILRMLLLKGTTPDCSMSFYVFTSESHLVINCDSRALLCSSQCLWSSPSELCGI